jgi:hypothetical protein
MPLGRLILAVAALAFLAMPAVAQVTDTKPDAKPAVATDPSAVPAPTPVPAPPIHVSPVPEPGSIVLISAAAAGWVTYWRRKWRAAPSSDTPPQQS